MKVTSETKVYKIDTYHLTKEIKCVVCYLNGKEVSSSLEYTGLKINGYDVRPIYKEDISLLKTTNPFWDNYDWFNYELPEPKNIDLNNIILIQNASHRFYDINKNVIPVVVKGSYIEANLRSTWYDIISLREHLLKHPNVVKCSELLEVPYYNANERGELYLEVLVLPEVEWGNNRDDIFRSSNDYLGIKQFRLNK